MTHRRADPPSSRTSQLLDAIRAADRAGCVLSVRELQAACNISTTSIVLYHLRRLAMDGDITLGPRGASRSYRLTTQGRGYPDDAELLRRCLAYFERELEASGPLVRDLKLRLGDDTLG